MHGVKRLFAWMMPRFDPTRFTASLVSLRGKDLSEDTLEQFGIDVTYLGPPQVRSGDVHAPAEGAAATSRPTSCICTATAPPPSGGCARRWMGIPAVLHEHANHTTTPWFQQLADKALARYTDLAIGVSASTAEFTTRARLVPAERTKVVYLGAPLDEFARPRGAEEIAAARRHLGDAGRRVRRRRRDPADAVQGQRAPGGRGAGGAGGASRGALRARRRGRARGAAQGPGRGARPRRSLRLRRLRRATSPRRSAPSTSWCSRRCGRARR